MKPRGRVAAHVASGRAGPFVELRCGEAGDAAAFKVELERLSRAIERGTLFLSDVDELNLSHQKQLAEFLAPCAAPPLSLLVDAVARPTAPFRVIASTSRSLSSLAGHGGFSKILWTILDYLRLRIPPLRERREDIPFFIEVLRGRLSASTNGASSRRRPPRSSPLGTGRAI